jgi:hypothetical protein
MTIEASFYQNALNKYLSPEPLIHRAPSRYGGVMWQRKLLALSVVTLVIVFAPVAVGPASSVSRRPLHCETESLSVREYRWIGGTGHVDMLFWVRNASSEACTLTGYPSVRYESGKGTRLSVNEIHIRGNGGNFLGGVSADGALPLVIMPAHGGLAAFWVDGLDIQSGSAPTPCINTTRMFVAAPNSETFRSIAPLSNQRFDWCGGIHVFPVVGNRSGTLPARPLSYFFGSATSVN